MHRIAVAVVAVVATAGQGFAQEPAYGPEDIVAAINIGARGDVGRLAHQCNAEIGGFWNKLGEALTSQQGVGGQWHGIRAFQIAGYAPLARVASYAEQSKARYEPTPEPTDDHIVGMLADDVFSVTIMPNSRGSMVTAARLADTGVQHVVVRPRGDKEGRETVQPLTVELSGSSTASNLFGSSVELHGVIATFPSADVIEIAEKADVEVILVTTAGEFKCNLDDTRILRGYDPRGTRRR